MNMKNNLRLLVVCVLMALSVNTVLAQEASNPEVRIYQGVSMSLEELQTIKGEEPFYCVQEIIASTVETQVADVFYCYDTEAEANQKYEEMLPATNQLFSAEQQETATASSGYWALYAHVAYSGHIADIGVCGRVNNIYVYSIRGWNNPQFSLKAYFSTNFTGSYDIISFDRYWLTTPYRSVMYYNPCV
jgi:hypothetical protein